jgi:hypothetical protein
VGYDMAAVDVVRLSGDPRARGTRQKDQHVGNVLAGAGTSERDIPPDGLVERGPARDVVEARGVNFPGRGGTATSN